MDLQTFLVESIFNTLPYVVVMTAFISSMWFSISLAWAVWNHWASGRGRNIGGCWYLVFCPVSLSPFLCSSQSLRYRMDRFAHSSLCNSWSACWRHWNKKLKHRPTSMKINIILSNIFSCWYFRLIYMLYNKLSDF